MRLRVRPWPLAAATALGAAAALPWYGSGYVLALAINILMFTVLSTAWAIFSGPTRHVSLATVAFFGIGAYAVAVLGEMLGSLLAALVGAGVSAAVALVVGLATLRLRGVYFVVFTFGLAEFIRQLVTWYEANVSGSVGRYVFIDVTQAQILWQLAALAALTWLGGWSIGRSRLGLALRMIGDDETVARHCGVPTTPVKLAFFALSATLMALVGAIIAPRWTYIDANIAFNPMVSFEVLIMALLGGAHRLQGPVLGVVPLVLLFEYLSAHFPNWFSVLLGCAFLAIVYLVPNGVVGLVETLGARSRSRIPPSSGVREKTAASHVAD